MTCTEFSKYLDDYMINNLSDDLSDKMRAHIESCEKCRAEYEFAEKIAGHLHNMDKVEVSDNFLDKVNKRIDAQNYSDNKFHIRFNGLNGKLKKLIANRKFLTGAAAACLFVVIIAQINMPDISRKKSAEFSGTPIPEAASKPKKTSAPRSTADTNNTSNQLSFDELKSLAEQSQAEAEAKAAAEAAEKEKNDNENPFLNALKNGISPKNNAASDKSASDKDASSENSSGSSLSSLFQRAAGTNSSTSANTHEQNDAQTNDSDAKSQSDTAAFLAMAEKRKNTETTDTAAESADSSDPADSEKTAEQQTNPFLSMAKSNNSETAGTNKTGTTATAQESEVPESTKSSEAIENFKRIAANRAAATEANPSDTTDEASYAFNSAPVSNSQNKISGSSGDGIPAAAGGSSGRTSSSSGGGSGSSGGSGGSSGGGGGSAVIGSASKITLLVSDISAAGNILSKYSQTSDEAYYTVYRSDLSEIYDELSEKDIDFSISYKYETNSDTVIITLK